MGTTAHVIGVDAPPGWFDAVIRRLDELEQRWSRFLPSSDVSRANARAGEPTPVAPETARLVATANDWIRASRGRFQPAVLPALVAAGYDRPFAQVRHGAGTLAAPNPTADTPVAHVDFARATITVPAGRAIDLGGIGKGAAADLVAGELGTAVAGGCINLGGDLRAWGAPPDGAAAWHVAVEVPGHADLALAVGAGAVATSSTAARRWRTADGDAHHIIDPCTGLPADTDLTSVTVIDREATTAEMLAKLALIAGADAAPDVLHGAPALLCTTDGTVRAVNGMEAYLT